MKTAPFVLLLALATCTVAAPPQPPTTATTPVAAPQGESRQEINDRFARKILERIGDRKDKPAQEVFDNIKLDWLKAVPASRFLLIMNRGYSNALGVTCTHCHDEKDFASDDKRPKRAAREMATMHRMINDRLHGMEDIELAPDKRFVNCFTCHRGTIDPTGAQSPSRGADAIVALELKLTDLLERGAFDEYARYLAPDYTLTTLQGQLLTREQALAWWRAQGPGYKMIPSQMQVRVYSDMAILTARVDGPGGRRGDRITKTFVFVGDKWLLAALHVSQIADEAGK